MKLPFKKYTVMSNNLIQKLGCADVYRTYVLLLIADKYTLTTDTTIDELASFVGDKPANYKGGKSSKSFNDKLRATGEVTIQNKDSGRNDRTGLIIYSLLSALGITEELTGSSTIHIIILWI